jgi:hypothetical protein
LRLIHESLAETILQHVIATSRCASQVFQRASLARATGG